MAEAQLEILQILAKERDPSQITNLFPEILNILQEKMSALSNLKVPIESLLVTQILSQELTEYRVPSPAARAASQLQAIGKNVRMGQRIQFFYTKTQHGVRAWDLPAFNSSFIDIPKYKELLFRATCEILLPFGVTKSVLRNWMFSQASYLLPPGLVHDRLEMPIFVGLRRV